MEVNLLVDFITFKNDFINNFVNNVDEHLMGLNTQVLNSGVMIFGQFTKYKTNDTEPYKIRYTYIPKNHSYLLEAIDDFSFDTFASVSLYKEEIQLSTVVDIVSSTNEEQIFSYNVIYSSQILELTKILKFIHEFSGVDISKLTQKSFDYSLRSLTLKQYLKLNNKI